MNFLKRIKQKIFFTIFYQNIFKECGSQISLFEPIRIDGAKYITIGNRVSIQSNTWLYAEAQSENQDSVLSISEGCVLGYNNHITAIKSVRLGKNVLTANNVYISDNLHSFEDINTPIMNQPVYFKGSTEVGDGSWLGENVCIIGAKVGRNCVIGANSVVTKDIPDYSVAVGSPAKVIKKFDLIEKKWTNV